jgi:hypothetical protein
MVDRDNCDLDLLTIFVITNSAGPLADSLVLTDHNILCNLVQ